MFLTVSVKEHDSDDARHYARGFEVRDLDTFPELADVMLNYCWSPCLWEGGARAKANFVGATMWAFDFDEGPTIPEVARKMDAMGVGYVIGLTKSHQKEKRSGDSVKPPCDRFRLVVPMAEPCLDLATFEWNMGRAIDRLGCDRSCKDGGRFFWPCAEIHTIRAGAALQWTTPALPPVDHDARARARAATAPRGVFPRWIHQLLRDGVPSGGRHVACYRLGANLTLYGLTEAQIVDLALGSPLGEIGANDVARAVRNGVARTRGG